MLLKFTFNFKIYHCFLKYSYLKHLKQLKGAKHF